MRCSPYKIYALAAGVLERPLPAFVLLTPLVRLPRFLAAVLLSYAADLMLRRLSLRSRLCLLTAFWLIFYAGYYAVMPN